jgi:hypothetical protein
VEGEEGQCGAGKGRGGDYRMRSLDQLISAFGQDALFLSAFCFLHFFFLT